CNSDVSRFQPVRNSFRIFKGSSLGLFHNVEAFLGEGTFGFVTKCHNFETDEAVAIKISKSDPSFLQQARREIAILKQLQCLDPDTCNIVRWNGYFFHKDHICLSFELLDQSLFAYMKERNNFGLPVMELRPIIYQINMALGHLKSKGIAHTDLKPDNVMVVDRHQKPLRVKLIDFGLACPASELTPGFIAQSLWYRAPEVMLHIPYNEAIDMWSLGLIAAELATGYPLYPGNMPYDWCLVASNLPSESMQRLYDSSLSLSSLLSPISLSFCPPFLSPPSLSSHPNQLWQMDAHN
uniref:Protein kinase domain-containing protein n=1 Tax=Scophthalmus maximus TaxID=52904 RepID=A0A8D2ZWS9_SCOMX